MKPTDIIPAMQAPGGPGAPESWGPGRKQGFGTSATPQSRVWYTIARGVLSDVFHPAIDRPLLRELNFLAAAPGAPPVDVAAEAAHQVTWFEPGVPSFGVESIHDEFRLHADYVVDPDRDALLVSGTFAPELPDLSLYIHASLHVDPNFQPGNDAQVLDLDPPLLLARKGSHWVALLGPFAKASVGFLNASDTYVDLHDNEGDMLWMHDRALGGNVALGAKVGIRSGAFQLALGLGRSATEAEENARESRQKGFAQVREEFATQWRRRLDLPRILLQVAQDGGALARSSAAVLASLEDKQSPGAFVASPSAPWGETCHDGNHVYNLVWARDLFQIATGLLHGGDPEAPLRALKYLEGIQDESGGWPQNSTIDGTPHWNTPELDEVAYPVLLAWTLKQHHALDGHDPWPMVRRAAVHLLTHGPATPLDRWEDAGGMSPSTIAAAIAALLVAAEFAGVRGDADSVPHLEMVADYWRDGVRRWCVKGAEGWYARLDDTDDPGIEFTELVRRGVLRPDDEHVQASLRHADRALKVETPRGAAWRRYPTDQYGEGDDGAAWPVARSSGKGRGRPWPLLAGERAQVELQAGYKVAHVVKALEAFAGPELLLPEQVWDGDPVAAAGLEPGGPTNSARPLGWAHAEYLKLLSGIARAAPVDLVEPAARRYLESEPDPHSPVVWHEGHPFKTFPAGRRVVVQTNDPAILRWSADGWATTHEATTRPVGLGLHAAVLPTDIMRPGAVMDWEAGGRTYELTCTP